MSSYPHMYSVTCVGNRPIVLLRFSSKDSIESSLMFVNNITSDVLIYKIFLSSIDFLCMQFSRYISMQAFASHLLRLTLSSVIRNLNIFRPLITGETSFHSTALLIGLARRIVVRPYLYLCLKTSRGLFAR